MTQARSEESFKGRHHGAKATNSDLFQDLPHRACSKLSLLIDKFSGAKIGRVSRFVNSAAYTASFLAQVPNGTTADVHTQVKYCEILNGPGWRLRARRCAWECRASVIPFQQLSRRLQMQFGQEDQGLKGSGLRGLQCTSVFG